MLNSENTEPTTVYLITTYRSNAALLNEPDAEKNLFDAKCEINLFDNKVFWDFLCAQNFVVDSIMKSLKDHVVSNKYTRFVSLDKKGKEELLNDIVDAAIKKYKDINPDVTLEKEPLLKLFGTIRKIKDTNVYITHNWYNKEPFNFDSVDTDAENQKGTPLVAAKHQFLEILFKIIQDNINKNGINKKKLEFKLFAHDMDIFDRRMRGIVVTEELLGIYRINLENSTEATLSHLKDNRLREMIKSNHVYISQHGDASMFYKHVLNNKLIKSSEENFEKKIEAILNNFLLISDEFADFSLGTLDINGESEQYIRIKLFFSSKLEFQFLAVFNQIIEFNHHAWKAKKRFIPPNLAKLIDGVMLVNKANDKYINKINRIKRLTQMPILVSSNRHIESSHDNELSLTSLDPRARYIDSSIWMRYVQIDDNEAQKDISPDTLKDLFPKDFNVYKTANALEVREFNSRLCSNSRLVNYDTGQGKRITPFPFCSEENSKQRANNQLASLKQKTNKHPFKIRVLLIDDKATVNSDVIKHSIDKVKIIESLLRDDFNIVILHNKTNGNKNENRVKDAESDTEKTDKSTIYIEYSHTLKNAKLKLSQKKYDILLLDYLLEYDEESKKKSEHSYGTGLLKEIVEYLEPCRRVSVKSEKSAPLTQVDSDSNERITSDLRTHIENFLKEKVHNHPGGETSIRDTAEIITRHIGNFCDADIESPSKGHQQLSEYLDHEKHIRQAIANRGPLNKFWIFFISTFSSAIREDFRVHDMHYSEKFWHTERGACPVITPQLFKNNFYFMLNRQIEELTDIGIVKGDGIITVIDYLCEIFSSTEGKSTEKQSTDAVKEKAVKNFNSLLTLKSHYNKLFKDYFFDLSNERECSHKSTNAKEDPVTEKGSLLVRSLFPDLKFYGHTFWEHLQHLLYLVAYGNPSQTNVMWHEYMCIRHILKEANTAIEQIKAKNNNSTPVSNCDICDMIENYLTEYIQHNNA